jgi:hypothetical protein
LFVLALVLMLIMAFGGMALADPPTVRGIPPHTDPAVDVDDTEVVCHVTPNRPFWLRVPDAAVGGPDGPGHRGHGDHLFDEFCGGEPQ